ncbi:MAG: hypothetical protein ACI9HU_001966, partial [Colwellia sp.]
QMKRRKRCKKTNKLYPKDLAKTFYSLLSSLCLE